MQIFAPFKHKFVERKTIPLKLKYNRPCNEVINKQSMNNLKNRVQLIGHLGMNPEIKTLDSGMKLAKFTIATNETYKKANGERVTETEWHQVIAWNKTAELVENYLQKGKEVALEGKLTTRSWEDEDGKRKFMTEVVCSEILFLGNRS